jgi:cytochrome c oxidase cbb3-type subunit III
VNQPRSFLALLLVWVVAAASCDDNLPGKPNPKNRPIPANKVLDFEVLFKRNCSGCHGSDGKQGPAPPLNDPLFRAIVPAAEVQKVLEHGRPGTPMPAFARENGGSLSSEQIQVLVHEIKGEPYRIVADKEEIAPRWGRVAPAPADVPPYTLPETAGNVDRGKKLFTRACASCHGDNGQGIGEDDKRRNKIHEEAFLALISDQALRRIIITGRQDLHNQMPDYSQKAGRPAEFEPPLTSADIVDLVALLGSWRKGNSHHTK